jgi:hypothetical protein
MRESSGVLQIKTEQQNILKQNSDHGDTSDKYPHFSNAFVLMALCSSMSFAISLFETLSATF